MSVNLNKGERVNLSKEVEGINNVLIGLGWDPVGSNTEQKKSSGFFKSLLGAVDDVVAPKQAIDCDAWAYFNKLNKLVYYGDQDFSNVALHHGDNLTGDGDGDDEQISITLHNVPTKVTEITVGVTIYKAKDKGQSFADINNTFVRIVDERSGEEICKFSQKELSSVKGATNFIAGKFVRDKNDWHFVADGTLNTAESISDAVHKL